LAASMPPVKTNWNESERNFYTILNLIVCLKEKKDTGYTAKFGWGRSEINKSAPVYHAFRGCKMYEAYRKKRNRDTTENRANTPPRYPPEKCSALSGHQTREQKKRGNDGTKMREEINGMTMIGMMISDYQVRRDGKGVRARDDRVPTMFLSEGKRMHVRPGKKGFAHERQRARVPHTQRRKHINYIVSKTRARELFSRLPPSWKHLRHRPPTAAYHHPPPRRPPRPLRRRSLRPSPARA